MPGSRRWRSCARLPLCLVFLCAAAPGGQARAASFTEAADLWGVASGDSMSYAAGYVDFDGDGDLDFYVNNHWLGQDFFDNRGAPPMAVTSHFYDTDEPDRHDQLWADFNKDGSPDHYLIHGREQSNELFWNRGGGILNEAGMAAGVADTEGRGREVTFFDADNDGSLDIFVANDYRPGFVRPSVLLINQGNETFLRYPNNDLWASARLHVASADYDLDGDIDFITTNPPYQAGEVWRNDGAFNFVDVTAATFPGIVEPLREANGLTWVDYDDDGDPDLFTASGNRAMWDFVKSEGDSIRWHLECESGEHKGFEVVTVGSMVTLDAVRSTYGELSCWYGASGGPVSTFPTTLSLGQIAGEPPGLASGTRGLFLWSTFGALADTVHVMLGGVGEGVLTAGGDLKSNGLTATPIPIGLEPRPPFSMGDFRNRLYRNEGDGTFTEATAWAFAVNAPGVNSLTGAWGDYDNDGWIDLYVANCGNVEVGNQGNYLYRNDGDGTFTELAAAEGVRGSMRGLSDGAAWGDIDGDGFLDLFLDNGAEHPPFGVGPRQLFMNSPNGNHWLKIDLRGLVSNGSGIGARLRFRTATHEVWRTRQGESDNCFANGPTIHVGLGAATVVDTLDVWWPSGLHDQFYQVPVDRGFWAIEGKPLREQINPHMIVLRDRIVTTLAEGTIASWSVGVDNFGGLACTYSVDSRECDGSAIPWLTMSADSGGIWPGGTDPMTATVNTNGMEDGQYCGRVVFNSTSFMGPDTMMVWLTVADSPVDAPAGGLYPAEFSLSVPRPNPASGPVGLDLALPEDAEARVDVFAVDGRRVAVLAAGRRTAGLHALRWDLRDSGGRRVAPGSYFIRATAGGHRMVRKVVILN